MPACVPLSRHHQSSDLLTCTSNSCTTRPGKRAFILPISNLVLAHVPLQTFLDFNAIYILIEWIGSYRAVRLCLLNPFYSQMCKISGSRRTWSHLLWS